MNKYTYIKYSLSQFILQEFYHNQESKNFHNKTTRCYFLIYFRQEYGITWKTLQTGTGHLECQHAGGRELAASCPLPADLPFFWTCSPPSLAGERRGRPAPRRWTLPTGSPPPANLASPLTRSSTSVLSCKQKVEWQRRGKILFYKQYLRAAYKD